MWFILAILGGYILLRSSSGSGKSDSKSSTGKNDLLQVIQLNPLVFTDSARKLLAMSTRTAGDPERFEDPFIAAWIAPEVGGPLGAFGYEYLYFVGSPGSSLANTAPIRVGAMRSKINKYKSSRPIPNPSASEGSKTHLGAIKWQSYTKLSEFTGTVTAYQDYKNVLGAMPELTVEQAKTKALAIAKAAALSGSYALIETATKEIPPIAKAIAAGAARAVGIINDTMMSDNEKLAAALHVTADVVSMVPVYGQIAGEVIKFGVSFIDQDNARRRAEAEAACKSAVNRLADARKEAADLKVPIPWHLEETYNTSCATPAMQRLAIEQLEQSLDIFRGEEQGLTRDQLNAGKPPTHAKSGLSSIQRDWVKQWWALAGTYMGNPRVYEVFEALGRDNYGGMLASDEQVMLVAAPVAVSHGWDVDKFAEALFNYSDGWRSAPANTQIRRNFQFTGNTPDDWVDSDGRPIVRNAWWLNWAVLAEDAFTLAETYKEPETPKLDFSKLTALDIQKLNAAISSITSPKFELPFM